MTAHNVETETSRAVREAQARQRAASRNRPPLQHIRHFEWVFHRNLRDKLLPKIVFGDD